MPRAMTIEVTEGALTAELCDVRTISAPFSCYPRPAHTTAEQHDNWELIGAGQGIHRPDLYEDLSIEVFLAGRKAGENQRSFK